MQLTHKIALCPTPGQERYFRQVSGCARFTWNHALAEWNRQVAAGERPTAARLKKAFNAVKYQQFPWLAGVHRDAHAQPFAHLARAWSRYFAALREGVRSAPDDRAERRRMRSAGMGLAYPPTFKRKARARHAFVPAGGLHHAPHDRAAGLCVYNDPAVAIQTARDRFDVRVVYIDIDAHHGDGVREAFYSDPMVLTISIHESGLYLFPGTGFVEELGEGAAYGTSVNVPLEPYTTDIPFMRVIEGVVLPLARAFRFDLIVSAVVRVTGWTRSRVSPVARRSGRYWAAGSTNWRTRSSAVGGWPPVAAAMISTAWCPAPGPCCSPRWWNRRCPRSPVHVPGVTRPTCYSSHGHYFPGRDHQLWRGAGCQGGGDRRADPAGAGVGLPPTRYLNPWRPP